MIAGVVLCAGRGSRMGNTPRHKVCLPIAGRPAVVRLIDTLRADGVDPLIVVVGHRAGDVVETIGSAHPNVTFVYQRDRLGTGHAARIGIDALCRLGYSGPVLVTMGDKWFETGLVRKAMRRFVAAGADLLVVSTPKQPGSSSGRLVRGRGGIIGNVERRDIEKARVLRDWLALATEGDTLQRRTLRQIGLQRIRPATKLWRAMGPLARFSRGGGSVRASELRQAIREAGTLIRVGGVGLDPDEVERRSPTVNQSVYLGTTDVFRTALQRIGRANAQDEYYLTDAIEIVAAMSDGAGRPTTARVVEYRLRRADDVMAFNTRSELQRIEEKVRRAETSRASRSEGDAELRRVSRTPQQWLELLGPRSPEGRRLVARTYGADGRLIPERLRALRKVVRLFARVYGRDRKCFLVRAPGRVNLMGRHIDHQGGHVHAMALDREIILAVAPRTDDVIRLANVDAVTFPRRELVLNDWADALHTDDWLNVVDGEAVRTHLASTAGDWSNYILASAVYQQHRHPGRRLRGMDVAANGNVPMAAGLSSSSAMVVAGMEAVCAVNGIRARPSEIVAWCGQAEWFVGSRGGSSDQAAIRLSRAGFAARMGFHPFRLERYVPIPSDASVLIAYSGEHAVKSAGARDRFNERVACYRLGLMLLQRKHPKLAARLEHIRDLSPTRLGIDAREVLRLLHTLPERIDRRELVRQLGPEYAERLERVFASHREPADGYTIRDVVAYGIGECERARVAADYLDRRNLAAFGALMLISHDGDRIHGRPAFDVRLDAADPGHTTPPVGAVEALGGSGGAVPLHLLAGAYACSTRNIDRLVDVARAVPGVYGAQLAGAGLGGCVMILAKRAAAVRVKAALATEYYRPLGMTPAVWEVRSVAGGGIIRP